MRIGKLSVEFVNHETLGKVLILKTSNSDNGDIFNVDGETLTLRVSKDTVVKLIQFVDEELEEELREPANA